MSFRTLQNPSLDAFRRDWVDELTNTARLAHLMEIQNRGSPASVESLTIPNIWSPATVGTPFRLSPNFFESRNRVPLARLSQPSLAPEDVILPELDVPRKFVIGLDYGTTFTSVSYSIHPLEDDYLRAFPWEVKTITNWTSGGVTGSRKQVPSESWYPLIPMKRGRLREENLVQESVSPVQETQFYGRTSLELDMNDSVMDDAVMDDDQSTEYLWGYDVPYQQYGANTSRNPLGLVKNAKSILLSTSYTQQHRNTLGPKLNELIRRKIIRKFGKKGPAEARDVQDVLTDFLIRIFAHTKEQLRLLHNFSDQCAVQFVLTVPTIWSPQSSRVLQSSMEAAIRSVKFGTLDNGSIDNLFIISEPEAAATFLIASSKNILAGETFVILDCGGGTVDAVTYTVDSTYPLRLGREEVPPGGDNCGASYLNENFKNLLVERLRSETYLFQNGETVESIVSRLIPKFEDDFKRRIDMTRPCGHKIYISGLMGDEQRGLRGSEAKRFEANKLVMHQRDYKKIFQPLLDRVQAVLEVQLMLAFEREKVVKKVFLVGGFGEAPSLRSHLRNYLDQISKKMPQEISLITDDQNCVSAVSSGSVLRAHNLENGPDRIVQSSYGFLRTEPYEPRVWEGHEVAKPKVDEIDGEEYVQTVVYFIVKGKSVPSKCVVKPMQVYHTFETTREQFLCEEILYVSDTATDSHYPRAHAKNRDVQVAGKIIVDMTFLRDEGVIKPISPAPGKKGKKYYKVEYELVVIVEGRNLRYEARYPAGGQVQKAAQISIAAAFRPGTG